MRFLSTAFLSLLCASLASGQQFTDITESAGVDDVHEAQPLPECDSNFDVTFLMNSGCAFGDYNNDGFPDLYIADGGGFPNVLYRNNGDGTFTDVTQSAGVGDLSRSMGVGFGDIDNDEWLDIYVANFGQPNKLYRNNRDGTFTDISSQAGITHSGFNTSLVFDDFDKDGWLDIYVITYGEICDNLPQEDSLAGSPNVLYRNNGDGTFTDLTTTANAGGGTRWSLAVSSVDIDNDGDQDIYVADDFKGGSTLLINEYAQTGNLVFTDKSDEYGVRLRGNMMCSTFGDIDNDGDFDFYSTNIREDPLQDPQRYNGNALFRNEFPNPTFTDISEESGTTGEIEFTSPGGQSRGDDHWGWGAVFVDFNFDGLLDIFEVNGWPLQDYAFIPNLAFINQNGIDFRERADSLGLALPNPNDSFNRLDSRGLAMADIDNDGDEDFYIRNNRERGVLFRNDYNGNNHWVQIDARGVDGNYFAVGTRFWVTAGGVTQTRYISGGHSYLSQSSPIVTFGLAQAASIDSLVVLWPSGLRETFFDLAVDRRYNVVEGDGFVTNIRPPLRDNTESADNSFVNITAGSEGARITVTGNPGAAVAIEVFNILGQRVGRVYDGALQGSTQEFFWNGANDAGGAVGSGVYIFRVRNGKSVEIRKMTLIR